MFDVLDRHLELACEFGVLVGGDLVEVVQGQRAGELIAVAEAAQLQPQAFTEGAGSDADRVEILNNREHIAQLVEVLSGAGGQVLEAGGQKAVVVEAAHDQFGEPLFFGGEVGQRELVHQVLLQRHRLGDRIHDKLMARAVVAADRGLVLGEIILPLVVDLGHQIKLVQPLVFRAFGVVGLIGGGVAARRVGQFRIGLRRLIRLEFLEGRIDLHFLLHQGAQFHHRHLQHFQRLAHLRRQRHGHALLLCLR